MLTIPDTGVLDRILALQLSVAAAGERPEGDRRVLGWWATDLVDINAGGDFLKRLLPETWRWAGLQAVHEAGRRADEQQRQTIGDPDRVRSLFHLGFELDEALGLRLLDLKRLGPEPTEILDDVLVPGEAFEPRELEDWIHRASGGLTPSVREEASGRRVLAADGELSLVKDPLRLVRALVAALAPVSESAGTWPFPHALLNDEGTVVPR